jgi:hypothetical protein
MRVRRQFSLWTLVLLLAFGAATAYGQEEQPAKAAEGATPAAEKAKPKAVPHDLEGRSECLMCHSGAMEGVAGVPEDHAGRDNETCLWCHGAGAAMQTTAAPQVPHELEGRADCAMCHTTGMESIPQAPEDHEGRPSGSCTMCHLPMASDASGQ